jgi:ADP-ribose pyrophosphatase
MSENIKKVYSGHIVDVQLEQVELPNGVSCELEIIYHPGGVAIIAMNDRNEICLLRQYRHAAGGWIWEIPAGKLEPEEAHALTAKRELVEEAGVDAQDWLYLGKTITSPGVFTEIVHLYLARDLIATKQELEEIEVLEVHWLSLDKVMSMVKAGDIYDAKTLVSLFYLQQHLADENLA